MRFKIIITTTNNYNIAKKIAKYLIDSKISACVQIVPNINSIFKWENNIVEEKEILLIIKTDNKNITKCNKIIKQLHNYECPEIISIDSEILNKKYKNWFLDVLG
tara:strand:- start:236 stop:550 length:315 start_codon:yes stop_codon:yes gene_type:complete